MPYFDHDITDLAGLLAARGADLAVTAPGRWPPATPTTAAALRPLAAGERHRRLRRRRLRGRRRRAHAHRASAAVGSSSPARRTGEEVVFDFFVDTPGRGGTAAGRSSTSPRWSSRFSGADQVVPRGRRRRSPCRAASPAGCTPTGGSVGCRWTRSCAPPGGSPPRASRSTSSRPTSSASSPRSSPGRPRRPASWRPAGACCSSGDRLATRSWRPSSAARRAGVRGPRPGRGRRRGHGRGGGLVTAADLAAYEVVERVPLEVSWRGHRLLTNPPPSFGGELVALGLLAARGARRRGRPPAGADRARRRARRRHGGHRRRPRPRGGARPSCAPARHGRHHPRERGDGEGNVGDHDHVQRRGVGVGHPWHGRHRQQHAGRGRPPPGRLPRRRARRAGGVDDGAVARGRAGRCARSWWSAAGAASASAPRCSRSSPA